MTQFCIEEAVTIAYDLHLEVEQQRELEEERKANEPERKPGEITDPVMQQAMQRVKDIHFANTGVRT